MLLSHTITLDRQSDGDDDNVEVSNFGQRPSHYLDLPSGMRRYCCSVETTVFVFLDI